jgi:hypothetical protein
MYLILLYFFLLFKHTAEDTLEFFLAPRPPKTDAEADHQRPHRYSSAPVLFLSTRLGLRQAKIFSLPPFAISPSPSPSALPPRMLLATVLLRRWRLPREAAKLLLLLVHHLLLKPPLRVTQPPNAISSFTRGPTTICSIRWSCHRWQATFCPPRSRRCLLKLRRCAAHLIGCSNCRLRRRAISSVVPLFDWPRAAVGHRVWWYFP